MISDIPWAGPVGAVRVGRVNGEFVLNPTFEEMNASDLDLRIAGTKDAILMVECGANEIPEDVMVAALELGHQSIQPIIDLQLKMQAEIGKPKREVTITTANEELQKKVFESVNAKMNELLDKPLSKGEFYGGMDELQAAVVAELCVEGDANAPKTDDVKSAFSEAEHKIVRERILSMGKRPDGRTPTEIRPIWCEVGLSPRAHGTGLFTRGETQVLSFATLGTLGEAQELDNLSPEKNKRYMHHYSFPPFSTGEVKMLRGQSRREVGHGALAERALEPVIPAEESFPYAIRVVSEALSSNGSTSMGSVCGSTLALMDAGVPIKAPVSGVAMGLITDDNWTLPNFDRHPGHRRSPRRHGFQSGWHCGRHHRLANGHQDQRLEHADDEGSAGTGARCAHVHHGKDARSPARSARGIETARPAHHHREDPD